MDIVQGDDGSKPEPPPDSLTAWSATGLRLSIELGKDLLAVQAQRRATLEQRASWLIPLGLSISVALATAFSQGNFRPEGPRFFAIIAGIALIVGMFVAILSWMTPPSGYAGMKPDDVMKKYAVEIGEHGLLKAVAEEYERRIKNNEAALRLLTIWVGIATGFAALGLIYAVIAVGQNLPAPTVPRGTAQPSAPQ